MMKVQSSMVVSQVVNHKWPADVGYSSRYLNKWELVPQFEVGCMFTSLQCKELCDSECSSRLTEWLCPVSSLFIVLTPDVGTTKN